MKRKTHLKNIILAMSLSCISATAVAEMTVSKSQGQLNIISDIEGTMIVKIIDPNNLMVINKRYEGNSFSWSPSTGTDGAYRYEVRIISPSTDQNNKKRNTNESDYVGGSFEVVNGQIFDSMENI